MARGRRGARVQLSTEVTLGKLVTTRVMADGGCWTVRAIQTPAMAKLLCSRISTGVNLGIHAIPFFANCVITIRLASVTSIQIKLCSVGVNFHYLLWVLSWHPAPLQFVEALFCLKKKGGAGGSKVAGGLPEPT
jgi:hypothetical protein